MCFRSGLKVLIGVGFLLLVIADPSVLALDFLLKGPKPKKPDRTVQRAVETSCVKLAFATAIRVYQKKISPVGGLDRCGFRPSCSAYGYQAISEYGPVIGLMMIGDRLTRCNIWKEPGPDYTLLPNGKLYDPPSKNVLHETP